tara:strand:- start:88 stop:867 length:780 start_codon:yes stop_codon:yes gene_type:complete
MKMIGFSFLNQAEDNLKDYALSYVKSYRDGIERDAAFEGSRFVDQKKQGLEIDDPGLPIRSDTDRTVPFAVLNMTPYFWWKLRGVLERLDVNVGLSFCSVAGPYFEGTHELPENLGNECYVYQNYEEWEPTTGVENAEGEEVNFYTIQINEFLGHLESGTSPKCTIGVNGLSPRQFAELIAYLSKEVGEHTDITKNDFESAPFILSPFFDGFIEELIQEDMETDQIAEELAKYINRTFGCLANAISGSTDGDVYCFYFE